MRFRTFGGILTALAVLVVSIYLSQLNTEVLTGSFALTSSRAVPVYVVLLVVFLLGFLPTGGVLLTQTLRRDLALRRDRRRSREAQSRRNAFRRAVDLQSDGQWAKAAVEFERVLSEKPEDFAALLRYGEVLRHLGRAAEALEVHRKASVLYPRSVAILYQLADDYDANGEIEVAGQIRDRVLRDFAGQGLTLLRRRRNAALAARDWSEASRLQERIQGLLGEAGESEDLERESEVRMGLSYQRAVDLMRRDRLEEAAEILDEILGREPMFIPAIILRGEAELLSDRPDAAVAIWRGGFEATGSPVFLQRLEDHFIELAQPMEAIESLHRLISAADNDLLPRFFLGRLYYRLEMHQEALRVLSELKERIESSSTFHFLLARIHERRGEMAQAVRALSDCVGEAGVTAAEYGCRVCRTKYPEWIDRCDACGSWNSVEMDFREERISSKELGVEPVPIWAIYHEADAFRTAGEGDEPTGEAG